MDRTLVALDLETTGLSPRLDRIIEVGAVRFRGAEVLARYQSLVRPEVPIPAAVQQLTGITDADVAAAPHPEHALAELIDFVADSPVVAHSGLFDLSFLNRPAGDREGYLLFDTLDLARILLPMAPSHSLPHLSRQLTLDHQHPHRALSDADAARQLFTYLFQVAGSVPVDLKDQMLAVMEGWDDPLATFLKEAGVSGSSGPAAVVEPPPAPASGERNGPPAADPHAIQALLGPDGPMAAQLADYELREAQQQMALAVAQLFQRGGRLVVEAGPGTGKSLAYLLPAVHHAVARKERVVVATNTITLQEQLFNKDIPFLKSWLPFDFTAALLKGRANYVSLRRWTRYLNAPSRRPDGSWFADEIKFKLRMLMWLAQTAHGDRSEIRWNGLDDLFWQRAASTADDCLAGQCENYRAQRCFYWNSRRGAQDADVIVTNHALLLADALRAGTVLPSYQHVVVDEAHQLEETAVDALTVRVGEAEVVESLDAMLAWHRAAWGVPDARTRAAAALVRDGLAELFREIAAMLRQLVMMETSGGEVAPPRLGRDSRLVLDPSTRRLPEVVALQPLAQRLRLHRQGLEEVLEQRTAQLALEPDARAVREFEVFREQWHSRSEHVEQALAGPVVDHVTWLSLERRTGRPLVHATSTRAGEILHERALRDKESVVFTSASLAVAGSFDYFKRGVGMHGDSYELILPSPFDYLSQALLCLPTDLLDLQDPGFLDQVAETVAGIARAIDGKTLVLFTAHEQLRLSADRLRVLLARDRLAVLGQNIDGTRRQLLQAFQDDPRAVLLGTSSFWEGIDIPGDALSCVVIVRLPFRVPTDPSQLARSINLRDSFAELMLPEAVLRLKQGFGRLIRKKTDRGAVVLMDHRVNNRTYGPAFLSALPKAAIQLGTCPEIAPAVDRWLQPKAVA